MENERKPYPIELIETGINILNGSGKDLAQPFLVYCLHPMNGKFLPLNRDYKPLGLMDCNKWAKYELYDFLLIDKELVDTSYLYNNAPDFNHEMHSFFFFTDSTNPFNGPKSKKRYLEIVKNVFKIKLP